VNPRSVINWIDQNLLPCYRTPGGHRRIRRENLLIFVRKHQIPTPATLVQFTVLIVDDDQNIADLIRTFLLHQGSYQVASASDGISPLIEVGRIKPDLLILDLRISGVDGIDVCRRIKSDSANRTAIIAVSGSSEYEERSLQSGADGCRHYSAGEIVPKSVQNIYHGEPASGLQSRHEIGCSWSREKEHRS
jgi:CheY-like chemotaxis protein